MRRFVVTGILLLCSLALVACTSWESTTFKTLSASKAVIDQAKTDYRSGAIPVNACSYAIINQATAADSLVVTGFQTYEQEKQAKAAATVLADQQAVVEGLLVNLAPLVSDIALLKTNPTAACAGVKL